MEYLENQNALVFALKKSRKYVLFDNIAAIFLVGPLYRNQKPKVGWIYWFQNSIFTIIL